jgi:hypothetical protein
MLGQMGCYPIGDFPAGHLLRVVRWNYRKKNLRYGVLIIDDAPHPKFPVLHVDDSVSTLLPNPPARQS